MKKKLFFIITGNNGATYIINCRSNHSIKTSLEFYHPLGFRGYLVKLFLLLNVFYAKYVATVKLKSQNQIDDLLQKKVNSIYPFKTDHDSSVLISPTGDKIIIHKHGEYFHKVAVDKSRLNIINEINIYEYLNTAQTNYLKTSKLLKSNYSDEFSSITLKNQIPDILYKENMYMIVMALSEMFSLTKVKSVKVSSKCENFRKQVINPNYDIGDTLNTVLQGIESKFEGRDILLGLVHNDFKFWNVIFEKKRVLVFDFEEAELNGLPLSDLFNYIIAPQINSQDQSSKIADLLLSNTNTNFYAQYLELVQVDLDYIILLKLHIIEKVIFYDQVKEKYICNNYLNLLLKLKNN